jgi:hypothetical protein
MTDMCCSNCGKVIGQTEFSQEEWDKKKSLHSYKEIKD